MQASIDWSLQQLLQPWQAGSSLDTWLFEQRFLALLLELTAESIVLRTARRLRLQVRASCDLTDAEISGLGLDLTTLNPHDLQLAGLLESCTEIAWLKVATGCTLAASELRQKGKPIGYGSRYCPQPWRVPVVYAHGLWQGHLVDRVVPFATTLMVLREALMQVWGQTCLSYTCLSYA